MRTRRAWRGVAPTACRTANSRRLRDTRLAAAARIGHLPIPVPLEIVGDTACGNRSSVDMLEKEARALVASPHIDHFFVVGGGARFHGPQTGNGNWQGQAVSLSCAAKQRPRTAGSEDEVGRSL